MTETMAYPTPDQLSEYLPILLFMFVALFISIAMTFTPIVLSRIIGAHKPSAEKLSEYECGFPAFEAPRSKFNVQFYRIALLFLIFDLEVAFLFPWAVVVFDLGWEAWWAMMIFLATLAVGFIYEWKKGALEWQ